MFNLSEKMEEKSRKAFSNSNRHRAIADENEEIPSRREGHHENLS